MIPFGNDSKRKYTCFVCGMSFKDNEFKDYKNHICEKHEEGREYIKCPLDRCGAPVRDMRSHFKVMHPQEKIPSNIQLRVLVWKDFKTGKRRRLAFEEGFYISAKCNGEKKHYRSSWEKSVYESLEHIDNVLYYAVEAVKIPYFYSGKNRDYIPDILVKYRDGSVELMEIKPKNQTTNNQNRKKWQAAEAYCLQRGFKFSVITEIGIQKLLQEAKDCQEKNL